MARDCPSNIGHEIRPAEASDASELAMLLNEVIARGGTTAYEEPFTADALAESLVNGPDVLCCHVAAEAPSGKLIGFQSLGRMAGRPNVGDIATFTRVGSTQRGIGTSLFAATRLEAKRLRLVAVNATVRADNTGGLAFYGKLGFVDHGVERAVPLKSGTQVDRISKHLNLNDEPAKRTGTTRPGSVRYMAFR